jgi:hypothetical protein
VRPVEPDKYVVAPWRREVVTYLNLRQGGGGSRYMCPFHTRTPMLATRFGWACAVPVERGETCEQRQPWVRRADLPTTF